MTLLLQVRKFFCINSACKRRIFTERLPQVAAPWARRTGRFAKRLIAISIALGGLPGERLSYQLGCGIKDSTLLYSLAKLPLPTIVTPKELGVDDFAFRKRQSYGTILVDLEQSRPIGLLADREAKTLAEWLKQHPGVQVLSRERSASYRSGMSQGAPDAIQVADRFHVLQNLREVGNVLNVLNACAQFVECLFCQQYAAVHPTIADMCPNYQCRIFQSETELKAAEVVSKRHPHASLVHRLKLCQSDGQSRATTSVDWLFSAQSSTSHPSQLLQLAPP